MRVVKGDLLSATEGYIVHGCNCQGVMGSGVALAIKNKYTDAYNDYVKYCSEHTSKELLGRICFSPVAERIIVANAFTQEYYGRDGKQYASYSAIEEVFAKLADSIYCLVPIHMPKIGCGLGGADWNVVKNLLEKYLGSHNVTVYEL